MCGRWCCSASSAASASASHRSSPLPTSPRHRRRASAAGSGHCSSWPSCSGIFLSFAINWLLQHIAGGPNEPLWLGLDAWRWMFLVMAIPAVAVRRAGVHHSRVTAVSRCQPQDSGSASGADHAAGREEPRDHHRPDQGDAGTRGQAVPGAICEADRRHLRHRVGRPRAVDLPAVRRHQRDLLLLQRAVAGSRIQRRRVAPSTP